MSSVERCCARMMPRDVSGFVTTQIEQNPGCERGCGHRTRPAKCARLSLTTLNFDDRHTPPLSGLQHPLNCRRNTRACRKVCLDLQGRSCATLQKAEDATRSACLSGTLFSLHLQLHPWYRSTRPTRPYLLEMSAFRKRGRCLASGHEPQGVRATTKGSTTPYP